MTTIREEIDGVPSDAQRASDFSMVVPSGVPALLEALQGISSELLLDRLLDKLLRAMLIGSSAQRCVLVMIRGSELRVEAEATRTSDGIEVSARQGPLASANLCTAVVQWALDSRAGVVLDDASAPNRFSADPYLTRTECRSVFCVPLVKETKLVGSFYLEHAQRSRFFTPTRVAVITALASQAAISLENACLYGELNREGARLRRIIDTIPSLVWSATPEGIAKFFNVRWLEYTGMSHEEAVASWPVTIHPDDFPKLLDVWQGLMASGKAGGVEARMRRADGEYRWVLFRAEPLHDDDGNVMEWFGSNTDIEERKQAEIEFAARARFSALRSEVSTNLAGASAGELDAQLDLALRNVGEFFELDQVTIDQLWRLDEEAAPSRDWTRLGTGCPIPIASAPFDELLQALRRGDEVRLTSVKDMPEHQSAAQRVLQELGVRSMITLPLVMGGVLIASMSLISTARELEWSDEALQRARLLAELFGNALAHQRAELELHRSATALQQAQRELAQVSRATTFEELTAVIAHQVNQPLAAMVADATACLNWLAKDEPDLPNVRNALEAIARDGGRAGQVLRRIRARVSQPSTEIGACDLSAVVENTLPLIRGQLERDGITLETHLARGLPWVLGDRIQLQQVVFHLVSNASEASRSAPAERRRIVVRTLLESNTPDGSVVVSVEDAGSGIGATELAHVFETFYTTKAGGVGMGLSISRTIIERHGGRLWAQPNPDHGTTFQFAIVRMT